jgi:thioredoxin reductase
MHDVVIIGGGPAGLSAALVLGRCRRDVLLIDAGHGRNRRAREVHNYLTRDGIAPGDLRARGRAELERYRVKFSEGTVTAAHRAHDGTFHLIIDAHETVSCRKLLLATGMVDLLPTLDGIDPLYGTSVHHCPHCDGWEHRDERLLAYGKGDAGIGLALALLTWSSRVIACTDGQAPSEEKRQLARRNNITWREEPIARLEGDGPNLRRIIFQSGPPLEADALFFNTAQVQRSALPAALGCSFKEDGGVLTNDRQATGVPGLYLAGDADREVQFAIVAAAEGATAGVAINRELQDDAHGTPHPAWAIALEANPHPAPDQHSPAPAAQTAHQILDA